MDPVARKLSYRLPQCIRLPAKLDERVRHSAGDLLGEHAGGLMNLSPERSGVADRNWLRALWRRTMCGSEIETPSTPRKVTAARAEGLVWVGGERDQGERLRYRVPALTIHETARPSRDPMGPAPNRLPVAREFALLTTSHPRRRRAPGLPSRS